MIGCRLYVLILRSKPMTKSDYTILIIFGIFMVVAGMNIDRLMVL